MKKIFLSFLIAILAVLTFAQAPEMLNYQAVVRNGSGELIKSASVSLRISILQATETGTAVYTETHNATTNSQGLLNLKIGNGTSSDNFANIDWAGNIYYLKVEMDPAGGTAYSHYSTSQILSVPYALFSKNADMLDGQSGAYYQNASNIASGTLDNARYNSYTELTDANRLDNNSGTDILLRAQADTMYDVKVAFDAYNLANDAQTAANQWLIVEFDTERLDAGGDFNNTNDRFIAPVTGVYLISANIGLDDLAAGTNVYVAYYINGLHTGGYLSRETLDSEVTQTYLISGSVVISLNKNDYVDIRVYVSGDTAFYIVGSNNNLYTHFSGALLFKQ